MNANQKKTFKNLLSKGFLPKELPFNFEVSHVDGLVDSPPTAFEHEKEKTSIAISHNVTRFNNFTRKLDIPNPVTFYRLAYEIVSHLSQLLDVKKKSPYCLSFPEPDEEEFGRAFIWANDWQKWKEEKIKRQTGFRYFFKTDISNFYPSIYTHIVPWVIEGKDIAKAKRTDKTLLGIRLDLKIRNCQDSQTQGLQIGPDTSFIISEVILNFLDFKILEELKSRKIEHHGTRFVDDYEFYFNSDEQAKQGLQVITRILNEYELAANPLKTQIAELPLDFEKEWVANIRTRQISAATDKTKRQVVIDYFNYILQVQRENPNEQVLSYALARIEIKSFLIEDQDLLFSLLINLIFFDSSIIKWVIHFINLDTSVLHDVRVKGRFEKIIPKLVRDCSERGRDNDVLWCLILCYLFDVSLQQDLSDSIYTRGNALVKLMSLDLVRFGFMELEIELTPNSEEFWGNDWILYYTVFTQDDFKDFRGTCNFATNAFFKALQKNSVSFYTPFPDNPSSSELDVYIGKLCQKVIDSEYKVEIDGEEYSATDNRIQSCSHCGTRFISEDSSICSSCWRNMLDNDD